MSGRWGAVPEPVATPARSSGRGWLIAGLLGLAGYVGYRVLSAPDDAHAGKIPEPETHGARFIVGKKPDDMAPSEARILARRLLAAADEVEAT